MYRSKGAEKSHYGFRYADHNYRHHPRGLIIYGPVTVSNVFGIGNATASSLLWRGKGNFSLPKVETVPTTRSPYILGSSQESAAANSTNSTVVPRCPLVPPNLGKPAIVFILGLDACNPRNAWKLRDRGRTFVGLAWLARGISSERETEIGASGINDYLFAVGPLAVNKSPPELAAMEKSFTEVKPGGRGWPADCTARHRVAIVVPFRDRPQHLQALLYNLHPMLIRQQIDYQIFVVEQKGEEREPISLAW